MSKVEHPLQALANYLPDGAFNPVIDLINLYKVHLTVSKERKSVLGDYRHAGIGSNHQISVNGNLNQYEFLITLLHELAHLLCFEKYSNRVDAHGKEWKNIYGKLLHEFIKLELFPLDIKMSLQKTLINPAATANGETDLLLVLRRYNTSQKIGITFLATVPDGIQFIEAKGRTFKKIKLRRKRIECVEISTGRIYLFSALSEVKIVPS